MNIYAFLCNSSAVVLCEICNEKAKNTLDKEVGQATTQGLDADSVASKDWLRKLKSAINSLT